METEERTTTWKPVKNTVAKRWRSDTKFSFVPLLSNSTSEFVHSSPRGTRHIFFFFFLAGEMTVWNLCHYELCDCFVSGCDDSQSSSSGFGREGNRPLSFTPFVKKVFSSLESCCKLPRSWIVVVDAVAMLDSKERKSGIQCAHAMRSSYRKLGWTAWHKMSKNDFRPAKIYFDKCKN